MKVLFLYTEVMGYNIAIFECLVNRYGASVDVVHWDQNKKTPYVPDTEIEKIIFHPRSKFSAKGLRDFSRQLKPDIVYTSGWQDVGYRLALKELKSAGIPIVMGIDSQWNNSIRQKIGAKLIKYIYKKRYFTHAWVPGPMQFECAARLGFDHANIVSNLLTGNADIFAGAAVALSEEKAKTYPRRFLYVGRLTKSKGVDLLIAAFKNYQKTSPNPWDLLCIGNGPLEDGLRQIAGVTVEPFSTQVVLSQYARTTGAFILPSRYEPWGVVAHEFAMAGLPLILSNKVGSAHQFLINGFNGYTFDSGSTAELTERMQKLASMLPARLLEMGRASRHLACALSPEVSTASFVSVLKMKS